MPRIFISYRRQDSQITTERIHDRLKQTYNDKQVFLDVTDDIPPGSDWEAVLQKNLEQSDVLIVIIGQDWERLLLERAQAVDFVRFEIEYGLKRGRTMFVIPVLVNDASVPKNLPDSIKPLLGHQVMRVRHNPDFDSDMQKLIHAINNNRRSASNPMLFWIAGFFILVVGIIGIIYLGNKPETETTLLTTQETSVNNTATRENPVLPETDSGYALELDFDDPLSFDSWSIEPNTNLQLQYSVLDDNSIVTISNPTTNWYALSINNLLAQNVRIETRVRIDSFNTNFADFFLLLRGNSNQREYQGWIKMPNFGGFDIWDGTDTTEIAYGEMDGEFSDWHIVRFETIDETARLFVDGELIAIDSNLQYKRSGRVAIQLAPQVTVSLDYLTVQNLDE